MRVCVFFNEFYTHTYTRTHAHTRTLYVLAFKTTTKTCVFVFIYLYDTLFFFFLLFVVSESTNGRRPCKNYGGGAAVAAPRREARSSAYRACARIYVVVLTRFRRPEPKSPDQRTRPAPAVEGHNQWNRLRTDLCTPGTFRLRFGYVRSERRTNTTTRFRIEISTIFGVFIFLLFPRPIQYFVDHTIPELCMCVNVFVNTRHCYGVRAIAFWRIRYRRWVSFFIYLFIFRTNCNSNNFRACAFL